MINFVPSCNLKNIGRKFTFNIGLLVNASYSKELSYFLKKRFISNRLSNEKPEFYPVILPQTDQKTTFSFS